jgi:hypothetical protein
MCAYIKEMIYVELLKKVNKLKPMKICTDLYNGKVFHEKCCRTNANMCCKSCGINKTCNWTCGNYLYEEFESKACDLYKEVYI